MSDPRHDAAAFRMAAPSTIADLHEALKLRIEEIATAFWGLTTKSAALRQPQVIDGWLPPLPTADVERFPFIIVRPRTGVDSPQEANQDARAEFVLVIGTYSDTDDGWLDVVHIIDAIRTDLAEEPAIYGTGFEQTGPLSWELPEEQPRPEWIGFVTTNWTLPRARRIEADNPNPED